MRVMVVGVGSGSDSSAVAGKSVVFVINDLKHTLGSPFHKPLSGLRGSVCTVKCCICSNDKAGS